MAENDQDQTPVAQPIADQPTADQPGQRFGIQRVYVKDVSFEAPDTPNVFRQKYSPQVNFSINNRSTKIEEGVFEVVLRLTADVKQEDKTVFLVEVQKQEFLKSPELKASSLSKYLLLTARIYFSHMAEKPSMLW